MSPQTLGRFVVQHPQMTTNPKPTGVKADDEDSVYDPNIVHGTVGSWNYIVFHDDEQPVKPKP